MRRWNDNSLRVSFIIFRFHKDNEGNEFCIKMCIFIYIVIACILKTVAIFSATYTLQPDDCPTSICTAPLCCTRDRR
jgi:hypothetical protein